MILEKPKMTIKIWKMPTPAAREQKVEFKKIHREYEINNKLFCEDFHFRTNH
jgi:hypothetical protein